MMDKNLLKIFLCFILIFSQLQAEGKGEQSAIDKIMNKVSREKSEKILTKEEAIEDLKNLNNQLKAHPAIYRVRSKKETKKEYEKILNKLETKENWNQKELFLIFARFTAGLKEGHTFIDFPLGLYNKKKAFPLSVYIRDKEVFIDQYNGDKKLIGNKIISINGKNIKIILSDIKELLGYDPGYENWTEEILTSSFSGYYQILYGKKNKYKIKYKTKSGEIEFKELNSDNVYEGISKKYKQPKEPITLNIKDDIAIIKVYSVHSKYAYKYHDLVDNIFKKIKESKAKKLIIDNRYNTGGVDENAKEIFNLVKKREDYGLDKEFYMLTGRRTFSMGIAMTKIFQKVFPEMTLIGNKPGGATNVFSRSEYPITLNNSNLELYLGVIPPSTEIIKFEDVDSSIFREKIEPDIKVELDPKKVISGRDLVMEKTLEIISNSSILKENNKKTR